MLKDEEVWLVPGGWEGSRRRRDGGDSRIRRRGRSREKLEDILWISKRMRGLLLG